MLRIQESNFEIRIGVSNGEVNLIEWSDMLEFEGLQDKFDSLKQMDFDARYKVLSILEKAKHMLLSDLNA